MKKVAFAFLFLFFLSIVSRTFAQTVNDACLWATVSVEKRINKKFSLFLTEEYRLKENFTRTNLFYTDLGVSVRPISFLKISLAYRSIQKYLIDNTFSYRHRLMLDITLKKKFGTIELSYRQRLQSEVRNIYTSESGSIPEWYSRNKFGLKYDLKKPITPYVAVELRYQINNPRAIESDKTWHRNRYTLGLDYKQSERHSFGLYYLIQQE
ncbi:MAG: DUF2490 domain-containing protein, partial [Bacteroidetes bacterium]|nr:DUF2490 domain-containing protein [Bacteroidota bacterium]